MISFVWSPGERLPAGTGGSENYTVGQVRELLRRGIPAQIVTVGVGVDDGRDEFADIPFRALTEPAEVGDLDGTVVFVTWFPPVPTREPAYQFLHIPPPLRARQRRRVAMEIRNRRMIATSRFSALLWAEFLGVDVDALDVVYPFAEPCFGAAARVQGDPLTVRILYAGRLSPEKGIYTLLEMLHSDLIATDVRLTFTATTSGADKPQGEVIRRVVEAHSGIRVVPACRTPDDMAALMVEHDIVVVPSTSQYWHETFGIVSLEAQHSGCRVVASDDGGLPETDCGGVILVAPDNSEALALGIREAIGLGPVTAAARARASARYTVAQSVDDLVEVLGRAPSRLERVAVGAALRTDPKEQLHLALLPVATPVHHLQAANGRGS